jgi:uncharacterized protein with HEPN domain
VSVARDRDRLETILKVIGDLDRRLGGLDFDAFSGDCDEIDLTAYRLSVIGENANKLSDEIKARNPGLPWRAMNGFRNLVSHEYAMIAPRFVWAATQELGPIRDMCHAELVRTPDSPGM